MQERGPGLVDVKDTIEYKIEQPVGSLTPLPDELAEVVAQNIVEREG